MATVQPLTVGQLAASAGVRADTVRYYERTGLLPPPDRTEGEHRRYGPADVDRLLFIRGARRLGLRLAEIRELVQVRDTGTCPCGPAEELLRAHLREIDQEIARLTALRAQLAEMVAGLSGLEAACPEPVPGTWCAPDCQVPPPLDREGGDRNVLVL
jgi:DNA-binding transcriptional MerR regulator